MVYCTQWTGRTSSSFFMIGLCLLRQYSFPPTISLAATPIPLYRAWQFAQTNRYWNQLFSRCTENTARAPKERLRCLGTRPIAPWPPGRRGRGTSAQDSGQYFSFFLLEAPNQCLAVPCHCYASGKERTNLQYAGLDLVHIIKVA